MARSVKDTKLDTRAARDKLKTGDAIHWRMLVPGELHLGYRRRVPGNPGVWIARRFIGKSPECTSGYNKTTLGRADDYQDADGRSVLSYADAQKLAHKRADAPPEENQATAIPTVAEAMQDYISYLRTHKKTARGAEQVARVHIPPALAATRIDKLTLKQLEQWRDGLVSKPAQLRTRPGDKQRYKPAPQTDVQKRARKATANRIQTSLKASLNLARRHHPDMSDNAWRQLKPFGKVDVARPGHLTVAEAQRLLNVIDDVAFRSLVQAALLTGCRYGELCRLKVADYSQGRVTIHETKSGRPRTMRLNEEGAAFFAAQCVGRPGDEVLFLRSDGQPWGPSHQARPMMAACKAAHIQPAVGFHQLRHTWASLSVMAGMPLILVAECLGHADGRLVERNYAHLSDSYRDQMIREHAPRFGISPANANVVPISAGTDTLEQPSRGGRVRRRAKTPVAGTGR